MPALHRLVVRDDSNNITPTMLKLLIALVVLTVTAILLIGGLLVLRAVRRSRRREAAREQAAEAEKLNDSTYRRLTIDTMSTTPAYVLQEKRSLIDSPTTPPLSPLPEIRITFPDEVDQSGRPQSGRVVVVRVGDNNAVGLEPLDDTLPPYEKSGERFESLDLDRMGGLKEKEIEKRYS